MIRGRKSPVVHVIAFRKREGEEIQLAVTPDVLDMTEYPKGVHKISWVLDTKGFHFSSKDVPGIEFTSPGWQESFSPTQVSECGKFATVVNNNRDGLAYAYNVHVIEAATGLKAFLDPSVGNRAQ
jgi:hypothetical protein